MLRGPETFERVGTKVNARYRQVLRRLGMNVYLRTEVDVDLIANSRDQVYDLTEPTLGRIVALYWTPDATDNVPQPTPVMLEELTYEEMKERIPTTDRPRAWAKLRVGANITYFKIDSSIPDGATVTVEGEEFPSELEGDIEPGFEAIYHDILVVGAKADELMKQKDASSQAAGKKFEADFMEMLNALALRQTLMAGGVIKQGKHSTGFYNPLALRGITTQNT